MSFPSVEEKANQCSLDHLLHHQLNHTMSTIHILSHPLLITIYRSISISPLLAHAQPRIDMLALLPRLYSLNARRPTVSFAQQGFDEFMNLVLDDAEEVYIEKSGKETKARQDLGK